MFRQPLLERPEDRESQVGLTPLPFKKHFQVTQTAAVPNGKFIAFKKKICYLLAPPTK